MADVGVAATDRIIEAVKQQTADGKRLARRGEGRDPRHLRVRAQLPAPDRTGTLPHVVLIVGVNGTGKTTTVGKLAQLLKSSGKKPLVVAADTFRAAAVEQLEIWAEPRRRRPDSRARRRRSRRGRLRRHRVGQGQGARSDSRRHGRPPSHEGEPHERARKDSPRRRARGDRRAARSAARARRHGRPERAEPGARVHERRGRERRRADQARRHGQRRHCRRDRVRAEAADPLCRRRRIDRRSDSVRRERVRGRAVRNRNGKRVRPSVSRRNAVDLDT